MNKLSFSKIMSYFGTAIALSFVLLGVYVLITDQFEYIPWNYRLIFGILMLSYGVFRMVNNYFKTRSESSEVDNDE